MNLLEQPGTPFSDIGAFTHARPLPTLFKKLKSKGDAGEAIMQRLIDADDLIAKGEGLSGIFISAVRRQAARDMATRGRAMRSEALQAAEAIIGEASQIT